MNHIHTRRGETQIDVNKSCHPRGMLSGSFRVLSYCRCKKDVIPNLIWDLRRLSLPLGLRNNLRGRWQIKSAMTSYFKEATLNKGSFRALFRSGFTLIELLVVVLIIGILAAVAVPQYQKAVLKAQLTEIIVAFDSYKKAVDLWVLEHGMPDEGTSLVDVLDTGVACVETDEDGYCYTGGNYWYQINCEGPGCIIEASQKFGEFNIQKGGSDSSWKLANPVGVYDENLKLLCQYWLSHYGVAGFTAHAKEWCETVADVTIE